MTQVFDTGDPYHSDEIARQLLSLHAESVRYLDEISVTEFFRPQALKWSPAEHVRHLHKSVRPLVKALAVPRIVLRLRFGRSRRRSRQFGDIRDRYRAKLAQGYGTNPYAPSARPVPRDARAWRAEIMRTWTASVDALAARVDLWRDGALDRYQLPHPLMGKLTVREMMFFTVYHNAHHVRLVAERRSPAHSSRVLT